MIPAHKNLITGTRTKYLQVLEALLSYNIKFSSAWFFEAGANPPRDDVVDSVDHARTRWMEAQRIP